MQRVRVGMIGLAGVFLLVMLATALLGVGRDTPVVNIAASPATNAADAAPSEPLAELGVAPGAPLRETAPARPAAHK